VVTAARERFGNGNGGFFGGYRARISPARSIATPAIASGAVIFGGGFGSYEIYALDAATGTLRWQSRTRDDGPTAAVVIDEVVLFSTESCTLLAVDITSGALLWEKWLGDPLLAQPAAAGSRVVIVYPSIRTHKLGAFDIRSGERLWQTKTGHDVITAPVISDGHVYLTTYGGVVSCIDIATGDLRWRRAMHATSAPFVYEGHVYVAQREGDDVARRDAWTHAPVGVQERTSWVQAQDGGTAGASSPKHAAYLRPDWGHHRKMEFAKGDAAVGFAQAPAAANMDAVQRLIGEAHVSRAFRFQGSRPVVTMGVMFETTGDCLEAKEVATGRLLWSWDNATPEEGERRLTPPAVANGRVLIGTWDGRVISFDAWSGRTRWQVDVGGPCHWQPVMSGGRVFAGLEDGSLVAFETDDPKDDGWPMWGGGPGHNGSCSWEAMSPGGITFTANDRSTMSSAAHKRRTRVVH
jgi:outer membrane protein assembly factor BamB